MKKIGFPYGKEKIYHEFSDEELCGVLVSSLHGYQPEKKGIELVKAAMAAPIGSARLEELAVGKKNVVIIISDHTRPVPSKIIIPPMLEAIRSVNPDADITMLVATGCHRNTKKEELIEKLGEDIVRNEKIVVHDCADDANLVNIGVLPSGGELYINKIAYEADLLLAEGFIEPHFFAGFSGGRKSVLPGVAGRQSVLANHCSEFIAHPNARTGVLKDNPIHKDMLWAALQR
jgi:nickel-dependent lactate racemase